MLGIRIWLNLLLQMGLKKRFILKKIFYLEKLIFKKEKKKKIKKHFY
jgi:hypothetical protein